MEIYEKKLQKIGVSSMYQKFTTWVEFEVLITFSCIQVVGDPYEPSQSHHYEDLH